MAVYNSGLLLWVRGNLVSTRRNLVVAGEAAVKEAAYKMLKMPSRQTAFITMTAGIWLTTGIWLALFNRYWYSLISYCKYKNTGLYLQDALHRLQEHDIYKLLFIHIEAGWYTATRPLLHIKVEIKTK